MRQKTNHKSWEDPHLAISCKCIDNRFFLYFRVFCAWGNWNQVLFDLRSCPLTLSRLFLKANNQKNPAQQFLISSWISNLFFTKIGWVIPMGFSAFQLMPSSVCASRTTLEKSFWWWHHSWLNLSLQTNW